MTEKFEKPQLAQPARRVDLQSCLAIVGVIGLVLFFLIPIVGRDISPTVRRTQCKSYLNQISLALHNYHDVHGEFPPAFTIDASGRRLHSWRTLILPFLEQLAIYDSIDLTKPWDDPVNKAAYDTIIQTYTCPEADPEPGMTTYHAVVGPDAIFADDGEPRRFREITDGSSNTFMVVEVAPTQAIHWMDPTGDWGREFLLSLSPDSDTVHQGGTQVALCDGSVRYISSKMSQDALRAMTTIAGDDPIEQFAE